MGNICRSPTAEGVFRKMVQDAGLEERILVDSAGTHAYHVGEAPDRRARAAAARRGYSLEDIKARRIRRSDFDEFAYILAMDRLNLATLQEAAGVESLQSMQLFLDFAGGGDVPDPYYGGAAGFERVLDLVEAAAAGLLTHLQESAFK